jgi:hypothetical protein
MIDGSARVGSSVFRWFGEAGLRRFAALYLLSFVGAVAVAPHRHLNSLEDLLCDGRSDSGIFVEARGSQDSGDEAQWRSARVIDDDPCLACFHHDFDSATEVIGFFEIDPRIDVLDRVSAPTWPSAPPAPVISRSSRAPPSVPA